MTAGIHPSGTGRDPALPPGRGAPTCGGAGGNGRPALPAGSGPDATPSPNGPSGASPASRVSVLAPRTRVDVALPPDVPIADLVPVLLDLAGESPSSTVPTGRGVRERDGREGRECDGREDRGGWTLAVLGQGAAEPHRTLSSLGVLDGDQLVMRRRADAAPPPLFDDVVDAVAEATPGSFWPWGPAMARRLGLTALGLALALAATALVAAGRGPGTADGLVTALVAGLGAAACVAVGAVCARPFRQPAAGTMFAVGGAALAAVCGIVTVPAPDGAPGVLTPGTPHLLFGAVLATATAAAALLVLGSASRSGLAALVGIVGGGGLVTLTAGVATVIDAGDPASLAAGAGAAALVTASLLPRTSIALARLPLPQVPGSAEELAEDPGVTGHADVERRTDRAHTAMTGLLLACGAVAVAAVAVLGATAPGGVRGVFVWVLAGLTVLLLALRSRTYANGAQALTLLLCALVAVALLGVGVIAAVGSGGPAIAVALGAGALGAGGLVLGVVVPGRRFSPVARRSVDVAEAVGIAAVLPVALAVMDLYTAMRLL